MLKLFSLFCLLLSGFSQVVDPIANKSITVIEELKTQPLILTEKTFPGSTQSFTWCGVNNEIVFLLTTLGELYRSTDHGKSWTNEHSKLAELFSMSVSADATRVSEVILHSTASQRLIFVGSTDGKSFKTTDGGDTYQLVHESSASLDEVKLHPSDQNLIMASTFSKGCHDETSSSTCFKTLYISKDFAETWQELDSYIVQFDWTFNLPYSHTRGIPKESIIYTKQNDDSDSKAVFGVWDKTVNLWRTDNLFKTSTMLVKSGNRFLFTSKYLMVAQVMENNFHVRLLISTDGSRSFKEAGLPFEMAEHSYTILDASDDVIFLHVNHWGDKALFGNVYVSNSHGLNYTLSLPHNVREEGGRCDFEKIMGLEGIYIANYQDNVDFDAAYSKKIHNPKSPKSAANNKQLTTKKEFAKMRTVITYDKGGEWGYIDAPKYDSKGKAIKCDSRKGCSLNLFGISNANSIGIYSSDSAVGLIMATGNVGTYLSTSVGNLNTYFSRDAGLTWKELSKGSFIYEFGDHGGLIVMIKNTKTTQYILYSYDEGHSWNKFSFTERPISVENIVIEPSALSQKFIIYGSRDENSGPTGVLIHIDFAELHVSNCHGIENPDSESSDYEIWTLRSNSADGDHCVLGKQISYTRRKQFSQCFNGEEFERPVFVKNCECTEADWECDYNFARYVNEKHGKCNEIFAINQTKFMEEQCSVADTYYVVNGYRKVAGDTCFGGVDHSTAVYHCVHWSKQVSGNGWMVIFFFLMIGCSLGGLTFISRQRKGPSRGGYKSSFSFNGSPSTSVFESISNFFTDLKDKVNDSLPGQWRYGYFSPGDKIPDSALDFIATDDDDNIGLGNDQEEESVTLYNRKKDGKKRKNSDDELLDDFNPRS